MLRVATKGGLQMGASDLKEADFQSLCGREVGPHAALRNQTLPAGSDGR